MDGWAFPIFMGVALVLSSLPVHGENGDETREKKRGEETCSVDTQAVCGWMNELMISNFPVALLCGAIDCLDHCLSRNKEEPLPICPARA